MRRSDGAHLESWKSARRAITLAADFTSGIACMSSIRLTTVPRGTAVARVAHALAVGGGDIMNAEAYAIGKALAWASTPGVVDAIKAATNALTTQSGVTLARPLIDDFIALVRPQSVIDRLADLRRAPANVSILATSAAPAAAFIAEGQPIPVGAFSLERTTLEGGPKIGGIVVTTRELARAAGPGAESLLAAELAAGVAAAGDAAFLDPQRDALPGLRPSSVTYGLPVVSSTGATRAAVEADLAALFAAAGPNGLERMVIITRPSAALKWAQVLGSDGAAGLGPRGGFVYGIPVLTSGAASMTASPSEGIAAMIDPTTIWIDENDEVSIDLSRSASLQMNDSPPGGAQQLVSLFANGLLSFRVLRSVTWRRAGSAGAVLDNIGY